MKPKPKLTGMKNDPTADDQDTPKEITRNPIVNAVTHTWDDWSQDKAATLVIPQVWARLIRNDKHQPDWLAIAVMADTIYWHRARKLKEPEEWAGGRVYSSAPKFSGDLYRLDVRDVAHRMGVSTSAVSRAVRRLSRLGFLHYDNPTIASRKAGAITLLYVCPTPEALETLFPSPDDVEPREYGPHEIMGMMRRSPWWESKVAPRAEDPVPPSKEPLPASNSPMPPSNGVVAPEQQASAQEQQPGCPEATPRCPDAGVQRLQQEIPPETPNEDLRTKTTPSTRNAKRGQPPVADAPVVSPASLVARASQPSVIISEDKPERATELNLETEPETKAETKPETEQPSPVGRQARLVMATAPVGRRAGAPVPPPRHELPPTPAVRRVRAPVPPPKHRPIDRDKIVVDESDYVHVEPKPELESEEAFLERRAKKKSEQEAKKEAAQQVKYEANASSLRQIWRDAARRGYQNPDGEQVPVKFSRQGAKL